MKLKTLKPKFYFLLLVMFVCLSCQNTRTQHAGWPEITQETKPWGRWWWMGNSVDSVNLKANLEEFKKAGLGGVEIIPIYGVHGYEDQYIDFLSPRWMENLEFTLKEGQRLHLGVDISMGSGWPFGGPWVIPDDACKCMVKKTYALRGGEQLAAKIACVQESLLRTVRKNTLSISDIKYPVSLNADSLQSWAIDQVRFPNKIPLVLLMAYSEKGDIMNLTDKVNTNDILEWTAPAGSWKLYAIFEGKHGKMVERACPGGEGDVIDHFSEKAINNYLTHFSKAFEGYNLDGLRAFLNDSYEVDDARGQADFTPLLFDEFFKHRGYDLRKHLPALFGDDTEEKCRRVLSDYRQTISDMILEKFTKTWHDWAGASGKMIRSQAHGSPGNILDLYAVADIPETESRDTIRIKAASSAAHVTGKKLVSSESATWLKDHFMSSLADVKQAMDILLLNGVNHIFYHGTNFSPQDAPWPGWLFYAAVHFSPTNPFWVDFGQLNSYITNVQSFLQSGKPDNDILLYYPIFDEYNIPDERGLLRHFNGSIKGTASRSTGEFLHRNGYSFDYISDNQTLLLECKSGKILTGGNGYQVFMLPHLKLIPPETLEKVIHLAENGATVLMNQLPSDVPGFGNLTERRAILKTLIDRIEFETMGASPVKMAKMGKGHIILCDDPALLLKQAGVRKESLAEKGFDFIRRTDGNTVVYFISNHGKTCFNGFIPFDAKFMSAVVYNPLSGKFGKTATSEKEGAAYLSLALGETCIIQLFPGHVVAPVMVFYEPSGKPKILNTNWELSFLNGGPVLPSPVKLSNPVLWNNLEGEPYKAFSGTAVYKTIFILPDIKAQAWKINLGSIMYSAKVRLNGKEIATLICPPYAVVIDGNELLAENSLEISVSNLMGNRIADMERKGQNYKIFYNANFPAYYPENLGPDGLFTTRNWQPQNSGMAGPVTLEPMCVKSLNY